MVCAANRHSPLPTPIGAPRPDPLGLRHTTLTWDVHTDRDNVHVLAYPCLHDGCPAWTVECELCGRAATITTTGTLAARRAAMAAAADHGQTHVDGCETHCEDCLAHLAANTDNARRAARPAGRKRRN